MCSVVFFFFFQAEDGIRDHCVTGVQTCALPILTIVSTRVADLSTALELPPVPAALEEIRRVVSVFRELRSGVTEDGRTKIKSPSGTLSTAEAISVITSGMALSAHF